MKFTIFLIIISNFSLIFAFLITMFVIQTHSHSLVSYLVFKAFSYMSSCSRKLEIFRRLRRKQNLFLRKKILNSWRFLFSVDIRLQKNRLCGVVSMNLVMFEYEVRRSQVTWCFFIARTPCSCHFHTGSFMNIIMFPIFNLTWNLTTQILQSTQ